eukprot:CAMPEP_0194093744 /NCGR_PEP_ID=MMETSP0149-20130528/51465_1 /TAXON_ID=122233 /ORGANISM="Chaetoceros debilis, Strain MM31A-1" /LENGTH=80 /DNA_ID=CAMNT_0038779157 /DNA_START=42 /DNA_END=280 /DNA_ORIENTATION=+
MAKDMDGAMEYEYMELKKIQKKTQNHRQMMQYYPHHPHPYCHTIMSCPLNPSLITVVKLPGLPTSPPRVLIMRVRVRVRV